MSKKDLELIENNDTVVRFTVTRRRSGIRQPYDLAGATMEFYLKTASTVSDDDAVMYTGDVIDAAGGIADVEVSASDMSPGSYVYHFDAVINGKRNTVAYGTLKVVNV